jgi:hypothetical protein
MAWARTQISPGPTNHGNDSRCQLPPGEAIRRACYETAGAKERFITIAALFSALAAFAGTAAAQTAQVQGVIHGRSEPNMTVQTDSGRKWSYATA